MRKVRHIKFNRIEPVDLGEMTRNIGGRGS